METNDHAEVEQPKTDTEVKPVEKVENKQESPDYRPKLSDEEQLAILVGRTQRLRTKLGLDKDDTSKSSSKPDNLSQKAFLLAAGISEADEVELAVETAKKWGMGIDEIVGDEDFTAKLEKLRVKKANLKATSEVKGGAGGSSAKETAAYWIAKGHPPTAADVPDRKTRATIARAMMGAGKSTGKFYND